MIEVLQNARRQYHQGELNISKHLVSAPRICMRNALHKALDDGKMRVKLGGKV